MEGNNNKSFSKCCSIFKLLFYILRAYVQLCNVLNLLNFLDPCEFLKIWHDNARALECVFGTTYIFLKTLSFWTELSCECVKICDKVEHRSTLQYSHLKWHKLPLLAILVLHMTTGSIYICIYCKFVITHNYSRLVWFTATATHYTPSWLECMTRFLVFWYLV